MTACRAIAGRLRLNSSFGRGVAALAGANLGGHAVAVAVAPALTRMYAPEDFGLLAVYGAILSILGVVASLRYELAIPLARDDRAADDLLGLSLVIVLAVSVLSGVVLWGLAGSTEAGSLRRLLWVLPLGLAGFGSHQALEYWAVRGKAFGRIARTRLTQSLTQSATQLVLGVLKVGAEGLLLGDVAGRFGASAALAALGRRARGQGRLRVQAASWAPLVREHRRFPLYTLWGSLVTMLGIHLAPLLLSRYFGMEATGYYGLATRLMAVPSAMLGQAVGLVFYNGVAERQDTEGRRRLLERAALALLLVSLGCFGFAGVFGPMLLEPIFGQEWAGMGRYVQMLSPWYALQLVTSPLSTLALVEQRQLTAFLITLAVTGLRLAGILTGAHFESIELAVGLFSGAGALVSLAYLFWLFRLVGSDLCAFVGRHAGLWGGFALLLGAGTLAASSLEAAVSVPLGVVAFGIWMLRGYRRCTS